MKKIALVGNPNCGKTTIFNALTGSNQYVGNWPGVTVEKKEGTLKGNRDIMIVDLPGIYSLSPYSLDEVVARDFLIEEQPDFIINLVDATNLERNLYLTTQLKETGIGMIVALNMMDRVRNDRDHIDTKNLSNILHCPIVEVSGLKNEGLEELIHTVKIQLEQPFDGHELAYTGSLATALSQVSKLLSTVYPKKQLAWFSLKHLEADEKVMAKTKLDVAILQEVDVIRTSLEELEDDDTESIVANARYELITDIIAKVYQKGKQGIRISDRIDRIVTNRWLAMPIFALIMTFVYYVSVTSVGTILTDFTNDTLFGEWISPAVESFLLSINSAQWLTGLIVNGIIGGVGAVLGFVPQMFVLFFFLAILEDVGYMSRIAFILDRVFRKFGLSGKSFIPMLIGTGCGVPGVMASRTIEHEKDRRMTIMTTTFVPCSAKLPIIALIAGALFHGAWWVSPSAYFIGIGAIIVSGIILKKTKAFTGDPSPFVMELPAYHMPKMSNIARSVWERGTSFIKKAGTVILLSTIVIWFLSRFGYVDGTFMMVSEEELQLSFLASLGSMISWMFIPLGWGHWEAAVAAITGLVAKENVVATFGILYGFAEVSEDGVELWSALAASFTTAAAFSFLVFNLLCAPCFAAIGAIKREMNDIKWTTFAIVYQCGLAYIVSMIIYQIWMFVETGTFGIGAIIALLALLVLIYFLFRKEKKDLKKGCVVKCQPS